jgi:hypothetical protein
MTIVRILAVLLLFALPLPAFANCRVHARVRIALFGTMDDPDVFVWDSRFRLRDYEGGTFDQMRALLPHARLAPPGTRAVVQICIANFVQSKFTQTPDEAIGIVIVSGPMRGQRGWVLGSDVRTVRAKTRGPAGRSTRSTATP